MCLALSLINSLPLRPMNLPTGNLESIRSQVEACLDTLPPGIEVAETGSDPATLREAFSQLLDVMQRLEVDQEAQAGGGSDDVTRLGEYAMQLQESLAGSGKQRAATAALAVEFALWIADHGGRIDTLEPVVDGLAMIANSSMDPAELESLGRVMGRITDAVAPLIREDLEKINPGRPWRVLLLNRSIVATRSHNTRVMEEAFAMLTRHLPEDAARFFTEGMEQMDALDYPPQVRKVMEKYHRQWTLNRSLH
jgi:hypothetical protein